MHLFNISPGVDSKIGNFENNFTSNKKMSYVHEGQNQKTELMKNESKKILL